MRPVRFLRFAFLPVLAAASAGVVACAGDAFIVVGLGDGGTTNPTDANVVDDGSVADAESDAPTGPVVIPGCEKTPSEDATVVSDTCGIFVAPTGSDTAAGTKAAPVQTLAKGIALAHDAHKRLYVCAARYEETLTLDAASDGVAIHGGFACPGAVANAGDASADAATDASADEAWTYRAASRPRVVPTKADVALSITNLTRGTLIEDIAFDVTSPVASGASSVAAIAKGSRGVTFRRVKITAGNGAPGEAGANGTGGAAEPVPFGGGTKNGNAAPNQTGGPSQTCKCGMETTVGGKGGNNNVGGGGAGERGQANGTGTPYVANPTADDTGAGGAGEGSSVCKSGSRGAQPTAATSGNGAPAAQWTLAASGIAGTGTGSPGATGAIGQGGGGGGGGAQLLSLGTGGGGGGACGGCGGSGGLGGSAGGASVALASIDSRIFVGEGSELIAGNGGVGGIGGEGQAGSAGGIGGVYTGTGCPGGRGGAGGKGGGGGGGAGGASFVIAFKGSAPETAGATLTVGTPGAGGNDGAGNATQPGKGASGIAQGVQALP